MLDGKKSEPILSGTSRTQRREFKRRALVALAAMLGLFLVLAGRLFWLQVVRYEDFTNKAESNRVQSVPLPPERGVIRDRNGIMLADSYQTYSLEVTRSSLGEPVNAALDRLEGVVAITKADRRRFARLSGMTKRFDPIPIRQELSDQEVATFLAHQFEFPGVELVTRRLRRYPLGAVGAHIVGYTGRISEADERRLESEGKADEYRGTYNMGKTGIERSYEETLRGRRGFASYEVTAGGRPVRRLQRVEPVQGSDLTLSIDINLQSLAEEAFGDATGALVAIEPSSGEVLALVSMPTYDPNLFLNGIDFDTWDELNTSPKRPLLNRPVQGIYPIGSTYKPFMALAGLRTGTINQKSWIIDAGYFEHAGHKFRDSSRSHIGRVDLRRSIVVSCDVYYYKLAADLGVDRIHDFMAPWGFGERTGVDIPGERQGVLPSSEWKKRRFGRDWTRGDTISLGIGQGYNAFTIMQLAHATATLANRGVARQPRLVKKVRNPGMTEAAPPLASESRRMDVPRSDIEFIINAMTEVTRSGTAAKAFKGAPYATAGKTGTAQVKGIAQDKTYDAKSVKKQHRDHGLFIAFAPAAKPTIAVAVILENEGWGASTAAPIARKVLDYWITGENDLGLPAPKEARIKPRSKTK